LVVYDPNYRSSFKRIFNVDGQIILELSLQFYYLCTLVVMCFDGFFVLFFLCVIYLFLFFFFFSSRRRHTRSLRDWSSDVCSSDLIAAHVCASVLGDVHALTNRLFVQGLDITRLRFDPAEMRERYAACEGAAEIRSEERRVGKECRSRGST